MRKSFEDLLLDCGVDVGTVESNYRDCMSFYYDSLVFICQETALYESYEACCKGQMNKALQLLVSIRKKMVNVSLDDLYLRTYPIYKALKFQKNCTPELYDDVLQQFAIVCKKILAYRAQDEEA